MDVSLNYLNIQGRELSVPAFMSLVNIKGFFILFI